MITERAWAPKKTGLFPTDETARTMNMKRQRGRNNGRNKPHMPVRVQTFDSSGPEVRIRGNAYQVLEKYLAMARDATAAGDRIAAENFYQHAEHYYRVINANAESRQQHQQYQQHPQQYAQGGQPMQGGMPQDPRMAGGQEAGQEQGDPGAGPQPLMNPNGRYGNPGDGQAR